MSGFMIHEQMQEQFAFFKKYVCVTGRIPLFSFALPDCSAMTGDYL